MPLYITPRTKTQPKAPKRINKKPLHHQNNTKRIKYTPTHATLHHPNPPPKKSRRPSSAASASTDSQISRPASSQDSPFWRIPPTSAANSRLWDKNSGAFRCLYYQKEVVTKILASTISASLPSGMGLFLKPSPSRETASSVLCTFPLYHIKSCYEYGDG